MADVIIASSARARSASTAEGTLSLSLHVVLSTPQGRRTAFPDISVTGVPAELDFARDRAEVGAGPGRPAGPAVAVWTGDTVLYQRKASASSANPLGLSRLGPSSGSALGGLTGLFFGSAQPGILTLATAEVAPAVANATAPGTPVRPLSGGTSTGSTTTTTLVSGVTVQAASDTTRQWFRYDFASRKVTDGTRTVGAYAINPDFIVQLLAGTLTGSPVNQGHEELNGVETTRYAITVDPTKADRNFSGTAQDNIVKLFRANGVALGSKVYPGHVWLDSGGLPRRIQVVLEQDLDPAAAAYLTVTLDLTSYGDLVAVAAPDPSNVADVSNLAQLLVAVSAQ